MGRAIIAPPSANGCRPKPSANTPRAARTGGAIRGATSRRPARAQYGAGWGKTVAAGSLRDGATPDGVLDLAGNVHEWTASIALPYPYRADDGREDFDKIADRVTRGGAADTGPETLRGSWRGATVSRRSTAGHHNIGFRCAKVAE